MQVEVDFIKSLCLDAKTWNVCEVFREWLVCFLKKIGPILKKKV